MSVWEIFINSNLNYLRLIEIQEFEELEKKSSEKQKRNENETRTETAENETKSHMEHHVSRFGPSFNFDYDISYHVDF